MTSWVSTITLLGYSQPTYSQMNVPLSLPLPLPTLTAATTCGQLQLSSSSVSASGFDSPTRPSNTVDNNLNTRWSNLGLPSFIQYNLGQTRSACSVDIAWYNGASRTMTFTISFSTDGSTFTNPVQFQSRSTTGLENYDFPDVNAQHVRITVTGNTQNNWASITEVEINAADGPPDTTPPVQVTGLSATTVSSIQINVGWTANTETDLNHYNVYRGTTPGFVVTPGTTAPIATPATNSYSDTGLTPSTTYYYKVSAVDNAGNIGALSVERSATTSPPPPQGGVDPFGIRKIYPTKASGGEEWYMNMNNPRNDPRTDEPTMTLNPPGCSLSDPCWRVTSTQVRYGVFTSSGYNPNQITTLDHSQLAQKGYMQSPNDWKNVEMTGYVKVITDNTDSENFAWYARGGRHTGSGATEGCEGSSIKGDLYYNGRVRFAKEQWHVSYEFRPTTTATTDIEDRWVGFKTIMWNTAQSGGRFMQMELWMDKNLDGLQNGPWERVYQTSDTGGWGDEGEECGGASDQIITWGGPIATFRWDGATDVHIKWFSVREIQPPT